MRVQPLLLAVFLAFSLFGLAKGSCELKNGNEADCDELEDVKYIKANNLTILKAPVREKILTSIPFKKFSSSLKKLDLSTGDVQFIESGSFAKLTNLVDLKLSDNSIGHFKAGTFKGLEKLKDLDLRRNDIRYLSPALTELTALKNLEVSGNPLACNCATLQVRDALLANGVKISKKVVCTMPSHLRGESILEPEAEVICMFEEQDAEMQADQAIGSGDGADEALDVFEELTELPLVEDVETPAVRVLSAVDNSAVVVSDDLIIPVVSKTSEVSGGNDSSNIPSSVAPKSDVGNDDFEFENLENEDDALIIEGSGLIPKEAEEEGSGWEGSGADILPSINPREGLDISEDEQTTLQAVTTEQSSTTEMSWIGVIWSTVTGNLGTSTTSDDKDVVKSVTDEEFIAIVTSPRSDVVDSDVKSTIAEEVTTTQGSLILNKAPLGGTGAPVVEEIVTKASVVSQEGGIATVSEPESTSKLSELPDGKGDTHEMNGGDNNEVDIEDNNEIDGLGKASTHESKKSMGSYVVLAVLLGVLAALIGFAAYKSTFCKKKPSNTDPEQGAEMKDMRKALLESNNLNQAKISLNGNTESAPLVEQKQGSWAEPRDVKRWPDSNNPSVENGAKYSPPVGESEPIKPPRKSLPPQEDTNGLQEVKTHAPMSTFAPRTSHGAPGDSQTPPNSPSSPTEKRRSPPLSPGTQRVKITLQDNPDSVPKTPILITRTKPGVNLVKTP